MNDTLTLVCILLFLAMCYLAWRLFEWPMRKFYYRHVYLKMPHWKSFAKKAKKRVGNKCQVRGCDNVTRLTVHHKTYKSLGHESFGDVVVLCFGHHKSVESGFSLILRDGTSLPGYKKR